MRGCGAIVARVEPARHAARAIVGTVVGPVVPERASRWPTPHEWAWIAALPASAAAFFACRSLAGDAATGALAWLLEHALAAVRWLHPNVLTLGGCCLAPFGGTVLVLFALLRQLDAPRALYTLPTFLGCAAAIFAHGRAEHAVAGYWVVLALALIAVGEAALRRSRALLVTAACLVGAAVCTVGALLGLTTAVG
jgi:hypothetical protein